MYSDKKLKDDFNEIQTGYSQFLLEASLKELKEKYVMSGGRGDSHEDRENRIPESIYDDLEKIDTTTTKKYLPWILKRYTSEKGMHTLERLKESVKVFTELTKRNQLKGQEADIYGYKTIENLEDAVKHFIDPDTKEILKTKSEVRREKSGLEGPEDVDPKELIFNNDKVYIVRPTTKNSSIKYGRGTQWCTSADGYNNLYNNYYLSRGYTLYYIITKEKQSIDKAFKIAAAIPPRKEGRGEYFYADDSTMSDATFKKYVKAWGIPL